MKRFVVNRTLAIFVCGEFFGMLLSGIWVASMNPRMVAHAQEGKASSAVDLATLPKDVEVLKAKVPD